jgi:hypothetical protein
MNFYYSEQTEYIHSDECEYCQNDRAEVEMAMQDWMDEQYGPDYVVGAAGYCDDGCWCAKVDYVGE